MKVGGLLIVSKLYLGRLHLGVFLVQTGLIIKILMVFAAVGATIAFQAATTTVNTIGLMVGLAVSAMLLWGWWLFSELDPGYVGQDAGGRPRRVVRVAVLIPPLRGCALRAWGGRGDQEGPRRVMEARCGLWMLNRPGIEGGAVPGLVWRRARNPAHCTCPKSDRQNRTALLYVRPWAPAD